MIQQWESYGSQREAALRAELKELQVANHKLARLLVDQAFVQAEEQALMNEWMTGALHLFQSLKERL